MNKKIIMGIIAMLVTGFLVTPSMAKNLKVKNVETGPKWKNVETGPKLEAGEKGPSKKAGKSNIGHLYLYEKAPESEETRDDPWIIVEGGMWGKMKYNLSGPTFDFVFNGHGLPIGQEYTLIYYPDPWPGNGLICLGSGIVVEDEFGDGGTGNIHIKGSVDTGDLPILADANHIDYQDPEADPEAESESDRPVGAKIFLVPSGDVDCDGRVMIGWTGDDANLYEGAMITFEDTEGTEE